jgi:hypothetical protein
VEIRAAKAKFLILMKLVIFILTSGELIE